MPGHARPARSDPAAVPDAPTLRLDAAIVGAQKCGTTTLAALLDRHPAICLADRKEAHLFDRREVQRRGPAPEDLERSFAHRQPGQLLLDATPSYLYLPGCIEALLRHAPDVAVIVILRSPAQRAVSHYHHQRRLGTERRPFAAAMALERRRLRLDVDPLAPTSAHRHASYLDRSRYSPQLGRLRALTERVHVLLLDDLITHPGETLDTVEDFLGVDRIPLGEVPHMNAGGFRRHRLATAVVRRILRRQQREAERQLGLVPESLR